MKSWVEIDLGALEKNIHAVNTQLATDTSLMFVVKADGYSHGAIPLAECAASAGVRWFAVAYLDEALAIRRKVTSGDILVIGVVDPMRVAELIEHNITPVIVDLEHGLELAARAREQNVVLPVHVKIDTGMGRLGLPWKEADEQLGVLLQEDGLDVRGLCSHFAKVEASDPGAANDQAERFFRITTAAEELSGRKFFKHLSSSRALLYHQEWDFDGVRPGIMLYGYGTGEDGMRMKTRPILQWKAKVIHVKSVAANTAVGYYGTYVTSRPTDIAVLACGYADGYLRALSNRGQVLVQGQRRPVVGRVSMNWIAVDLGPVSGVKRGDEAVLIGEQGNEVIWANELAAICRTIPYEILTNIDAGLERRYIS